MAYQFHINKLYSGIAGDILTDESACLSLDGAQKLLIIKA